jgi:diguanylate cyclase (GGDEF)-like protein
MDSKIGLIIQIAGVSLIALLTLFLRRSINVVALKHWTNAWIFLCFALFCLRLAFGYEDYSTQLFSFYFLSEYVFGFLLVSGCRSLVGNNEMRIRQEVFILPFVLIAFGLPFLTDDFNLVFNVHSLIMSGFFAIAFLALWRTKLNTFGWKVMLVALAFLVMDFFQYFVVFTARQYMILPTDYLAYNSVIDLVLQTLLGFGMVIVLLEQVLTDAKIANEKLKNAHKKLEELAHIDPLTTALNRHAFHGYLKKHGDETQPVSGCVGFFDIDDLKHVNDMLGHSVGDFVIRAVVRAIREVIRAEDLIFRWGGDEFFVILIGLDAQAAYQRMERIEGMLTDVHVEGAGRPLTIHVSHAFENFSDLGELETTIEKADAMMYLNKQQRKADTKDILQPPAVESEVHLYG